MIKIGNKIYRNLQEQVAENMHDIELLIKNKGYMGPYETTSDIPEDELKDNWIYLIGTAAPYSAYLYTNQTFLYLGLFPLAGPQGPQGEPGEKGDPGEKGEPGDSKVGYIEIEIPRFTGYDALRALTPEEVIELQKETCVIKVIPTNSSLKTQHIFYKTMYTTSQEPKPITFVEPTIVNYGSDGDVVFNERKIEYLLYQNGTTSTGHVTMMTGYTYTKDKIDELLSNINN